VVAAFALGVGLLVGCSDVGEPTVSPSALQEDIPYGVAGAVYDDEDLTVANPVPGVYCVVWCHDCETYVFSADTSDINGSYYCTAPPYEAAAHDGHMMTVYGIVNNEVVYASYMFQYSMTSLSMFNVNLYPVVDG
jgi:hypothetical protein